jgi:hypothetical protein
LGIKDHHETSVAFRSAKDAGFRGAKGNSRFFRGAKGDNATLMDWPVLSREDAVFR